MLERFEFETKQRIEEHTKLIFLFQISINDSAIMNKKENWVPENRFRKNIFEIIKRARKISPKIFFVGSTLVDEAKTNPIPWDTRVIYTNENIRRYNAITEEICQKNNIPFIDILDEFMNKNYKKLLSDGAHPNSKGHELIFQLVRAFLIKNKVI